MQEEYTTHAYVTDSEGNGIEIDVTVRLFGEPKIPDVDDMVERAVQSVRSQMTDIEKGS